MSQCKLIKYNKIKLSLTKVVQVNKYYKGPGVSSPLDEIFVVSMCPP